MQKFIIDRFEGEYAVCENEDGKFVDILKSKLPDNAKQSDIIIKTNIGYEISEKETQIAKDRIKSKLSALFNKN